MNVPNDLKYTEHDEWVRVSGDIATIGITDYAQDQLGELVHAELPEVGASFSAGDVVCEVESVKAVAEIYTPVGGEIVEVNPLLEDRVDATGKRTNAQPELINSDPYGTWLFRVRMDDRSGLAGLMDAAAYAKKIGG